MSLPLRLNYKTKVEYPISNYFINISLSLPYFNYYINNF